MPWDIFNPTESESGNSGVISSHWKMTATTSPKIESDEQLTQRETSVLYAYRDEEILRYLTDEKELDQQTIAGRYDVSEATISAWSQQFGLCNGDENAANHNE